MPSWSVESSCAVGRPQRAAADADLPVIALGLVGHEVELAAVGLAAVDDRRRSCCRPSRTRRRGDTPPRAARSGPEPARMDSSTARAPVLRPGARRPDAAARRHASRRHARGDLEAVCARRRAAPASRGSPTSPGSTRSASRCSPRSGRWARSLSTQQGKGLTPEAARISALMESLETYTAEQARATVRGSYRALAKKRRVVDVRAAAAAAPAPRSRRDAGRGSRAGISSRDEPVLVPLEAVTLDTTFTRPPVFDISSATGSPRATCSSRRSSTGCAR